MEALGAYEFDNNEEESAVPDTASPLALASASTADKDSAQEPPQQRVQQQSPPTSTPAPKRLLLRSCCVLVDDWQSYHFKESPLLKALTNLINVTCHQLDMYLYIILQTNLKDQRFWKLLNLCSYAMASFFSPSGTRFLTQLLRQLQVGPESCLRSIRRWFMGEQPLSNFVTVHLNPTPQSFLSEVVREKWIPNGYIPQLQLFLLELGGAAGRSGQEVQPGPPFTVLVCIQEKEDDDKEKEEEAEEPTGQTTQRYALLKANCKSKTSPLSKVMTSAQTSKSLTEHARASLFVCLPVDSVKLDRSRATDTRRKKKKLTADPSKDGEDHQAGKDAIAHTLSPGSSLGSIIKERIEETFPFKKRFAVQRIANYLLRTPALSIGSDTVSLKGGNEDGDQDGDEDGGRREIDTMGFLDVLANGSLHLLKDREHINNLRQEFGPFARAFQRGSRIPARFAPGLAFITVAKPASTSKKVPVKRAKRGQTNSGEPEYKRPNHGLVQEEDDQHRTDTIGTEQPAAPSLSYMYPPERDDYTWPKQKRG